MNIIHGTIGLVQMKGRLCIFGQKRVSQNNHPSILNIKKLQLFHSSNHHKWLHYQIIGGKGVKKSIHKQRRYDRKS